MSNEKLSRKQFAYLTIKEKILTCTYMPNSFLNEDMLCEELGISRTPVRDALSRLEQDHLIRILPKKGVMVAPLSAKEINMVYEGRILLEPFILSTYCQELPEHILDQMNEIQENYYRNIIRHADEETHRTDNDFHHLISSQCTNRYFLQTLKDIENQNARLRVLSSRSSDKRLFASYNEHQQILKNLCDHNLPGAVDALKSHLLLSKEAALHCFIRGVASL